MIWLLLVVVASAVPQSKRRQEQIRDLIKKSDLVVLAVAQAYYPILDLEKYRLERAEPGVNDPRRRSRFTLGTVYKLSVNEVLYQKAPQDPNKPGRVFYPADTLLIYTPEPLAHPLDANQVTFFPAAEYLVFLKQIKLDPDNFPRGVRQDLNTPMHQWETFPNPAETYFQVVRDPLAAKVVDDVWSQFVEHTRTVISQMRAHR